MVAGVSAAVATSDTLLEALSKDVRFLEFAFAANKSAAGAIHLCEHKRTCDRAVDAGSCMRLLTPQVVRMIVAHSGAVAGRSGD